MDIKIRNINRKSQRVMIVAANKNLISVPNDDIKADLPYKINVASILNEYLFYEHTQPPQPRCWATLEDTTDAILDNLEIDLQARIGFQSYNPDTNTDPKLAQMVRQLAKDIKAKQVEYDVSFDGADDFNENANIVAFFDSKDGTDNPTLELHHWVNWSGFYDSYTLPDIIISTNKYTKLFPVNEVSAVILAYDDGESQIITEEADGGDNWEAVVNNAVADFGVDDLFICFSEYSR